MALLLFALMLVILLDVAAGRWGIDSRDFMDNNEWERRYHLRQEPFFSHHD